MKKAAFTYEEGVERAQALVDALEKGSMTLEESFAAYEEATKIVKQLEKMLDVNEKRITVLMGETETELAEEVEP